MNLQIPNDVEKEKFVLGSMLLKDGEIIPDIAAILSVDDFYRPEHRIIFNAIFKIYNNKKPVTILSLLDELQLLKDTQGKSFIDLIGIDYIFSIPEFAHTTAYAVSYANVIKEKSDFRKLIRQAESIIDDARAGCKSPLDIIADSQNAFNSFNHHNEEFFNVADYLRGKFTLDIEKGFLYRDRKSGFYNLDNVQQWNPGLYILGATPACGKTTFAWQLLEQFAENDETCIFCSYEMSKKELAAKTLARRLFINNRHATLTAADILNGGWCNGLTNAAFWDTKINFNVRKFSDETVDTLLAILRPIIGNSDKAPIICIDYLQRLIPRNHKTVDTRTLIDDALFKLKDFSQETNTTFFCISTFNRTNYNLPVSFENFKESGGIEYTADVVWALQLNITDKLSGEKIGDTRQKIDAAKKQQPREINLRCLKNRYGFNYDCYFNYFSAHDYFESCTEFDFISKIDEGESL